MRSEISWFSALCDDDYEFLGVADPALQSSWEHYEALQIVIKMTRCNGQPVAKISDEPSKTVDYDPSYVKYLREVFDVPEARALEETEGIDAD